MDAWAARQSSNWGRGGAALGCSGQGSPVRVPEEPGGAEELEREKQRREGDSEGKH